MEQLTINTNEIRIRKNNDINLFSIDRDKISCIHKSEYCLKYCYNNKLYKIFKLMNTADIKNEYYWHNGNIASDIKKHFQRRKTKRIRFMSRGECFKNMSDVYKVKNILENNKDIVFHIPTRAWRDKDLYILITNELHNKFNNVRIFASIDPSNTIEELKIASKFCTGTMFFGNNEKHPLQDNCKISRCPKTWNKTKTVTCKNCNFCYNSKKQNLHIWLKKH